MEESEGCPQAPIEVSRLMDVSGGHQGQGRRRQAPEGKHSLCVSWCLALSTSSVGDDGTVLLKALHTLFYN